MIDISNNIITISRGDSFSFTIPVNVGSTVEPNYYTLNENDKVYLGILEPDCSFENAIVRKIAGYSNYNSSTGKIMFTFKPTDTEYLLPGNYYYQAKLYIANESGESGDFQVYTIMGKKKFIILD